MRRKVRNIQKSTQSLSSLLCLLWLLESFYQVWNRPKASALSSTNVLLLPMLPLLQPPSCLSLHHSVFWENCVLVILLSAFQPLPPDPILADLTPPTLSLKILDLQETRHLGQTSQRIIVISLEIFSSVFCDTTLLALHRLDWLLPS